MPKNAATWMEYRYEPLILFPNRISAQTRYDCLKSIPQHRDIVDAAPAAAGRRAPALPPPVRACRRAPRARWRAPPWGRTNSWVKLWVPSLVHLRRPRIVRQVSEARAEERPVKGFLGHTWGRKSGRGAVSPNREGANCHLHLSVVGCRALSRALLSLLRGPDFWAGRGARSNHQSPGGSRPSSEAQR